MREHARAELQVEQAALEVDEADTEGGVGGGEGAIRAEGGEAGEEDVDGDLETRLSRGEDVVW